MASEYLGGRIIKEYESFIHYLEERKFSQIGWGGFRFVFIRNNIVIKVPHVKDGLMDNKVEAAVWRKYKKRPTDLGVYLAPCRLLPNGCLMMVNVHTWDYRTEYPKWSSNVDANQIGLYKERPVAYDYALDVTERFQWEEEWGEKSQFFQDEWLKRKPHLRKEVA